ncbi:unnamed protein product, partial [Porites lobata]
KDSHPLLQKEKELSSAVQRILPKSIADSVVQKGSRLAHLYGLPKTHKKKLAMRPILSATGTYNYKLAKWLDEKLKPLSVNEHTVNDIFVFADELREMKIKDREVLVSYDLLRIATKNQLFQFEGNLYEQVDGVAMGSPLGPLMANAFMCKIEKQLETENKLPTFYKRYVDDTLSVMPDLTAASEFLTTLNESHPSINFTMELEENGKLPFLGMNVIRNDDLVQSTIRQFIESKVSEDSHTQVADKREAPIRIVLPFKDQKSANIVRKQLADLSRKINADISPVYTSYVGYTCRHLHQRIEEHKGSAIGNHLREQHDMEPEDIAQSFRI